MWVVYRTASPFAKHVYDARFYIRKIDIRTGSTIAEQPIAPGDSQFDPNKVLTRTGLLLDGGVIYMGFGGAVCDAGGGDWRLNTQPHGWVVALDGNSLSQLAVLNTTPHSNLGGIWQSGYGLAADQNGFVYALTGNNQGLSNGQLGGEMSEAILKLKLNRQTQSFDVQYYTAPNWKRLDDGDTDLASGGPLVLPNGFIAGAGKQGWLYVFDPSNMNQPQQAFQAFYNSWHSGISPCDYEASQANGPNVHGTPAIWQPANANYSLLYAMPEKEYLKAFRVDNSGRFDERPIASTLDSGIRSPRGMPGGFVSLSADGGRNGIVWASAVLQNSADAINTDGSFLGRLMAFDAISLRKLWQSADQPAVSFAKFIPPTIAAGKVFQVAYQNEVVVYGLTSQGNGPAPSVLPTVRQVSAVWRNPDHLDLFMTSRDSADGSVLSTNWEAQCQVPATPVARGWRGWFPIYSSMDSVADAQSLPAGFQFSAAAGQAVTAVWRNPSHLDLFATGVDGRVMSIVWEPPQNQNSGWQAWFPIGSATGIAAPSQPVTAVWRNPNHLDLFMTDKNGRVMSTYFDNNAWQPGWFPIAVATGQAAPGQPVTAVWRNPNHLDLFMTDKNGRVMSTYFDNNAWQPGWFAVAPATGAATPGQPVTAVWSNANHLDLFSAAPDGRVLSTYFENNNWLGSWFSI